MLQLLMVAKILKSSALFKAVKYNTGKIDKQKGELLKVSGFGPLQGLSKVRPEDYINYLKMISAQNKRVKKPQFHAAISAKGQTATKEELLEIACEWMNKMGYGDQPYLVIFHKDTGNNHVHIVSTRVGMDGKKIDSNFERIRSLQAINQIMQQDEKQQAAADLKLALSYRFQTKAQFKLILEQKGYIVSERQGKFSLVKGGTVLMEVDQAVLTEKLLAPQMDLKRTLELRAILYKYRKIHSAVLHREEQLLPSGLSKPGIAFTSDLAAHLKKKLGIQLIFHGKHGKELPYGYTVLDSARQCVFKGSEILNLQQLLTPVIPSPMAKAEDIAAGQVSSIQCLAEPFDYHTADTVTVNDTPSAAEGLSANDADPAVQISIVDDIDDEAIHGRNRQRKKQARTNTR